MYEFYGKVNPMKLDFYMPTRVISGEGCVKKNAGLFSLGKKCIIVTGRRSAKASGALDDVLYALGKAGCEYVLFDKIGENPLLSVCAEGGKVAAEFGAKFVVGIGGGSPLDASKAIAAFAANPGIEPMELYNTEKLNPSLPIIGIPTTAGTGSEVNPYAVITLDESNKKKTFKSEHSYFKYAFIDPKYTCSLGHEYSVSTALDAFCHCIESYLSPKSTDISRMFAVYGARLIWDVLVRGKLSEGEKDAGGFTYLQREALAYAATAGGVAINTTGTGFPHPLGYNLTLELGVPHGKACAVFTGEYIKYNARTPEGEKLLAEFAAGIGASVDEIAEQIPKLANVNVKLDADTIKVYVEKVKDASNYANSPYKINEEEMAEIYRKLFS